MPAKGTRKRNEGQAKRAAFGGIPLNKLAWIGKQKEHAMEKRGGREREKKGEGEEREKGRGKKEWWVKRQLSLPVGLL